MTNPDLEKYKLIIYNTNTLSEILKLKAALDFLSTITNSDKVYKISFKINLNIE